MNDGPAFVDHFAPVAADYARFRPGYPPALFDFLASVSPDRDLAWDCGTGTGIAAVPLADRFSTVVATDASEAQLAQAPPHPRITWRAAPRSERPAFPITQRHSSPWPRPRTGSTSTRSIARWTGY